MNIGNWDLTIVLDPVDERESYLLVDLRHQDLDHNAFLVLTEDEARIIARALLRAADAIIGTDVEDEEGNHV